MLVNGIDRSLKVMAGKGKVLKELVHDPTWRKRLDQAKTDAEVIRVLRELSKAKRYSFEENEV